MRRREMKVGDIAPNVEFTPPVSDISCGAQRVFNVVDLPPELQPLASLISEWGFGDSVSRFAYAEYCRRERPGAVESFIEQFRRNIFEIVEWLRIVTTTYAFGQYPPVADALIAAKMGYLELAPPSYPDGYTDVEKE